jgi:hypothetical protein
MSIQLGGFMKQYLFKFSLVFLFLTSLSFAGGKIDITDQNEAAKIMNSLIRLGVQPIHLRPGYVVGVSNLHCFDGYDRREKKVKTECQFLNRENVKTQIEDQGESTRVQDLMDSLNRVRRHFGDSNTIDLKTVHCRKYYVDGYSCELEKQD